MEVELRELKRKDYAKAIQYAITGMHFHWYLDSRFLLNLYGRYFWYLELGRATQVIAAYVGDRLAGVLLAEMKGEPKQTRSFWRRLYIRGFEFLQNAFYKDGVGVYDEANRDMLAQYLEHNTPQGEILFLAADPESKTKGIGSRLLQELERRERGKTIYLYTDDACTYQFYEHRGFARACERDVVLDLGAKRVPLKCLLYSKVLGESPAAR